MDRRQCDFKHTECVTADFGRLIKEGAILKILYRFFHKAGDQHGEQKNDAEDGHEDTATLPLGEPDRLLSMVFFHFQKRRAESMGTGRVSRRLLVSS